MDLQQKISNILSKKSLNENSIELQIINKISNKSTKEEGFRALVDLFKNKVYWQARRNVVIHEDADDISQNVFIKIWNNLDKFRGDSQLSTWIFRITTNEIIDFATRKQRQSLQNQEYIQQLENAFSTQYFTGDEIEKKFQKALIDIPPRQRMVFTMRYYDETPFDEIAEKLQLSTGAVKASYHHAFEKMKKNIINS